MVINQSSLCLMGLPDKGIGLLNCAGACRSHPQRLPFCLQVSGVLWMGGWLRRWWVRSKQEPVSEVFCCWVWSELLVWTPEEVAEAETGSSVASSCSCFCGFVSPQ